MARKTVEIFSGYNFGLVHDIDEKPNHINFQLHNHDDLYEVVLLLNGDCEFHVEGNIYRLHPHDIIFTRPTELHKMVCLSEKKYDRIILYIKTDFIKEKKCEKYLNIFENRELGTGNLIVSDIATPSLEECLRRLLAYSNEREYFVMDNVIIELLYLLNQSKNTSKNFYIKDENVRNIILYINSNLDSELNLESLAKTFYLSKPYLCKIFKKTTGYTVVQYINYKRILLVDEYRKQGQNITQASLNAGYKSYSSFYRAYVSQFGKAPRDN